ncbi:autotransporter outer membrane beta-barrel domain-containing protein, partial [Sutterella sp.]|uniref:autotransporter outer membrane beta-barrel domain-containing protein n=1 Tax=Sutterella sp. TaxID=1981025 RepID=UPI003FD70481
MFGREPAGAGWTLRPAEGFFAEPFVKLSYLTIHAKDYAIGTGSLGVDMVYSLEAEAGATFGGEFTAAGAASRPYVVVSGMNAFNKNVTATVGADTADASIDGAGLRMGAGLSVDVAKNLTTNAALNYMRLRIRSTVRWASPTARK